MHDTHMYTVAEASHLNNSNVVSAYAGAPEVKLINQSSHIHPDGGMFYGLSHQQPSVQPRDRDERKHVAIKRLLGDSFGGGYYWPIT